MGKVTIECEVGQISDGYHTFDELYAHRCTLFAALMKSHATLSWKSLLHDDGTMYDGWFIAGMNLPSGVITYHLPIDQFWDNLKEINELERAPEWDGHTSDDVIKRLIDWMGVEWQRT
jgi:hypothetical protein